MRRTVSRPPTFVDIRNDCSARGGEPSGNGTAAARSPGTSDDHDAKMFKHAGITANRATNKRIRVADRFPRTSVLPSDVPTHQCSAFDFAGSARRAKCGRASAI